MLTARGGRQKCQCPSTAICNVTMFLSRALTHTACSISKSDKKKSKSYESKPDCWSISKHRPLKQGDSQYFLLVNNLVRIEGCSWQESVNLLCLCLSAAKFQTLYFSTRRGHLAQPRNPKCTEKYRAACLILPNTLALVLYLSLCQTICCTSLEQPLFSRAHWPSFATRHQWCKSVLVLKE